MNKHVQQSCKLVDAITTPSVYIQNLLQGDNNNRILAKLAERLELQKKQTLVFFATEMRNSFW